MEDTEAYDPRPERAQKFGFMPQKEIVFNEYLPYADDLIDESLEYLAKIKANIARTVILSDPTGFIWINDLAKYLQLYGPAFSKEDHVYFVKLICQIILNPNLDRGQSQSLVRVATFANVLSALLKKRELLSPDDLSIPWYPFYQLYESTLYSKYEYLGMIVIPDNFESSIKNMIRAIRIYFPVESTAEMLKEWRPHLCPYDTNMEKAIVYLELFLPTHHSPDQHQFGFKLWLDELMAIWTSCHNTPVWENNMICLFARLSQDQIGYIDWEPFIPKIFTHLIRSLNLTGAQHKVPMMHHSNNLDINSVVVWIVSMLGGGSSCQSHLTKLFKAIDSYYHPSNTGKWNIKLLQLLSKLPDHYSNRIHKERYKKPSWRTPVPDSHKLTEKDITDFVLSMKEVVLLSMFSRFGCHESAAALQHLSTLRPEIVIPPVLEKLYSALETLTEPHRLTASMSCVVSIARSLIHGGKYYPEGRTHVVPLLLASLEGLDVNDMRKCMLTFQFISTFVTLVPIIDCSSAVDVRDDLTEIETQICLSTVQFEDFVLQFMDRCFVLIENSAMEQINRLDNDNERLNSEEGIIEVGIASTFGSIFLQSSPLIFKSALEKLQSFVTSHIFETKVAGRLAAILIRSCSKANPELSLQTFLPHFSKLILTLTENESNLKDEILDGELLFSLLLVSEVVRCNGKCLLKYKELIVQLLDRILHLACRKGYTLGGTMIRHVLKALTQIYALDFRSISKPWSVYGDFKNELPIKDWGCAGELHTLNIDWHVPNEDELKFAQELLEKFLKAELDSLNLWIENKKSLTREQLQRSLHVILECVVGAAAALPPWEGPTVTLYDTLVPINERRVKSIGSSVVNFADNSNIRQSITVTFRKVLNYMMKTCEDDTKSLCLFIKIYHNILIFFGITKQEFQTRWKGFHVVKRGFENKLTKKKQNIRGLIVDRFMLQHELRLLNNPISLFTELHRDMMNDLMMLSTSHYSQVRARAQEALGSCFQTFPYCYRAILPKVIKILDKNHEYNHEEFKGTLYLLIGSKRKSLLTVQDWTTLSEVWPALVNSPPSEKPSIIKLIDSHVVGHVKKYFDMTMIELNISEECINLAKSLWTDNKSLPLPSLPCPSVEEIELAKEKALKRNEKNRNYYKNLIEKLVDLIEHGNLHWRYKQLAFVFLSILIRYDIEFPTNAVNLFTKSLIDDALHIRKIAISSFSAILKQLKPIRKQRRLEPIPTDNAWMQYDPTFDWENPDVWSSTVFIDKPHVGFYNFPDPLMVYETNCRGTPFKELNESDKVIYNYFSNSKFIEQLFEFLSLEEQKGKDKFSSKRFYLWKGFFRNYGNVFVDSFMEKIKMFVASKDESSQRCAAEFLAGLVRGSKHWNLNDYVDLKNKLEPIMKQIYGNVTTETLVDWGTCSATIFQNRDSRRLVWLLKIFFDDPLQDGQNSSVSSFIQASRLYLLLGAINQQEWRGLKLLQQILRYLEDNHLTHAYQNVRERIAGVMCNIFAFDVQIPCLPHTLDWSPKRADFIEKILPRLEILRQTQIEENDSKEVKETTTNTVVNGLTNESIDRKNAKNLLKTLSRWIMSSVSRISYSAPPELFKLLPIMCLMQSETTDEELVRETFYAIILLSQALLKSESIEMAIEVVKQINEMQNWHARNATAKFLQQMVSSNLFVIMNNKKCVDDITGLILKQLNDERVEVRESAALTLSGFLHCEFINIDDKLLNTFKTRANHKLVRRKQPNGLSTVDPDDLTTRHGGILGLCACVNAFPYDVPTFMPDVLVFMSSHLNDPQPIPTTIKKTLANFRRTHLDSWRDHKLKFTEDQLTVITDLLVSPSYYA